MKDKENLSGFYTEFRKILFDNSISLSVLNDLDGFFNPQNKKVRLARNITSSKIRRKYDLRNFIDFLKKVSKAISPIYASLKNCYILNLGNPDLPYTLMILRDDNCFLGHLENILRKEGIEYQHKTYIEFTKELTSREVMSNFLCIIMVSPKVSPKELEENIFPFLKVVSDSGKFEESKYISILNDDYNSKNWYRESNDMQKLKDDIECAGRMILTNEEISNNEEKIIKKCFENSEVRLLEYKLIKSKGYSGSKVIEVIPRKGFGINDTKRFVIKINKKNKGKIKEELKKFNQYIHHYYAEYQRDYQENETHEAIMYTYASPDSMTETFSLADILSKYALGKQADKNIIKNIFSDTQNPASTSSNLFKVWKDSKSEKVATIKELYEDYIKLDDVKKEMCIIRGVNTTNNDLDKNLDVIFNKQLRTYEKVCHGDLHTENIFISKDLEKTYLIDFGLTGCYQSCLDHATLECSIRYNHIPRYIEIDELIKIENELLKESSFLPSMSLSKYTSRDELKYYLDLMHEIRTQALGDIFDQSKYLDYYVALFMVSCRQISYPDLNQFYIYHTIKTLSDHLIKNL